MIPDESKIQRELYGFADEPMVRAGDPITSHEAAEVVRPHRSKLQKRILDLFKWVGPMTASRAERFACFDSYSPSTVRKRISELARAGYLVESGIDRTGRAPSTIYKYEESMNV